MLRVQNLQEPGYRCDGGGLYLRISDMGSKSWLFRFTHAKRAREMGLGPYPAMSLAAARAATQKCRESLVADVDPIEARNSKRATARIAEAELITFKECGEAYVTAHEAAWSNDKHRAQWRATLSRYVYPVIGAKPVKAVDTALAVKILEPIWSKKPETASRVRGRIEVILNWAKVRGYRSGENPAQWRGHLDQLHPAQLDCWRVGAIAACVGIIVHYLAENPRVQRRLRQTLHLLPAAVDEILRMHAPLISNRCVTTKQVEIGGHRIAAGERITLMWASANRDEAVWKPRRISPRSRRRAELALRARHPRVPGRATGPDGTACRVGGTPEAHPEHLARAGPSSGNLCLSRKRVLYAACTNFVDRNEAGLDPLVIHVGLLRSLSEPIDRVRTHLLNQTNLSARSAKLPAHSLMAKVDISTLSAHISLSPDRLAPVTERCVCSRR